MEGVPLKLVVTSLVLALSLPTVYSGLHLYDALSTENRILRELERIVIAVKQVYFGGAGSTRTIDVDLSSGMFTLVNSVRIGDKPDGNYSNVIRYSINGQENLVVVHDPSVPMISDSGDALILPAGKHTLRLMSTMGCSYKVVVSVV